MAAASNLKNSLTRFVAGRRDSGLSLLIEELASGEARSGNDLAAKLGVTRAAIWKQIERLRELGLGVSAQAGNGYRLDAPIELLSANAIESQLNPQMRARLGDVDVHWQLDSTSSELLRRAATDPRSLIACLAEIQSQGRGRRGRAWQTPIAGGIALSLLRRFDNGMASLAGLSLVVGIAVVRALADCSVSNVGLKWPNDLVARNAKLAGILVELGGDALGPCHAVIGIGINCRFGAQAGVAIDQPWIDLASLANPVPTRNQVVACVLQQLIAALDRFDAEGFSAFIDDYARLDVLRGREVSVLRADGQREGIVRGVDARGALLVAFEDGERAIDSGEVSIRERACNS